jgi:hypothetical protein
MYDKEAKTWDVIEEEALWGCIEMDRLFLRHALQ